MESISKYYKILGLSETAKFKEIQKRYFDLMKIYHPDVYHAKNAEEKAKEINEAYFKILKYLEAFQKENESKKEPSAFSGNSTLYVDFWIKISKKNKQNINNYGKRYITIGTAKGIINYSTIDNKIHIDYIIFDKVYNNITKTDIFNAIKKSFEER